MLARWVIVSTAVFNLALALGIWATANLPGDPTNPAPAQAGFGPTLQSTWRIVAASLIAQVVAEQIDTEGRVVASNAVSVPIDSVLFVVIAFAGAMPGSLIRSIIWTNIVWKGLISVAMIPLIYSVRERAIDRRSNDAQAPAALG